MLALVLGQKEDTFANACASVGRYSVHTLLGCLRPCGPAALLSILRDTPQLHVFLFVVALPPKRELLAYVARRAKAEGKLSQFLSVLHFIFTHPNVHSGFALLAAAFLDMPEEFFMPARTKTPSVELGQGQHIASPEDDIVCLYIKTVGCAGVCSPQRPVKLNPSLSDVGSNVRLAALDATETKWSRGIHPNALTDARDDAHSSPSTPSSQTKRRSNAFGPKGC